ncbi:MAG TPA: GNAT family N-acetyltransferase [Clostridiales bacterium]|jgi:GNAT superfamily N-acetyltransferase|nr:GNAT family N-acetyltransferase [Clostridiales bacterium]
MSAEVLLRKCRLEDCDTWVTLNQQYVNSELAEVDFWCLKYIDAKEQFEVFKRTFYAALREPEHCILFAIEADGNIVGFANCMTIFSIWAHGRALVLEDLFIVEDARGKGYGRETMLQLKQYAKDQGYKRLQFKTFSSDVDAADFYRKMGYTFTTMNFYRHYF